MSFILSGFCYLNKPFLVPSDYFFFPSMAGAFLSNEFVGLIFWKNCFSAKVKFSPIWIRPRLALKDRTWKRMGNISAEQKTFIVMQSKKKIQYCLDIGRGFQGLHSFRIFAFISQKKTVLKQAWYIFLIILFLPDI